MHSTISHLALKQNKAAAKACCRFLCNTTISPRALEPRARYFPLISTRFVLLSAAKIPNGRQPFQFWSVCLFVSFDGDRNIERKRRKNSLARFKHAFARSAGVASRFAHCMQLYKCDYMFACMRACQLITWLRCFSTSSRNKVSLRDVTQNTKNETPFRRALRYAYRSIHTCICMYICAHFRFYSRDVVLTLVIPHGEARITEIRLPHAPS